MNRIAELRKQNKFTQTQLAEMLLVDQTTVSLWENGKAYPDVQKCIKVADIFSVSLDYLLGRSSQNYFTPAYESAQNKEIPKENLELSEFSRQEIQILKDFIAFLGQK